MYLISLISILIFTNTNTATPSNPIAMLTVALTVCPRGGGRGGGGAEGGAVLSIFYVLIFEYKPLTKTFLVFLLLRRAPSVPVKNYDYYKGW